MAAPVSPLAQFAAQSPPSHQFPPTMTLTTTTLGALVQTMLADDAAIDHNAANIHEHYTAAVAQHYDRISPGFLQSAHQLAQRLPDRLSPRCRLQLRRHPAGDRAWDQPARRQPQPCRLSWSGAVVPRPNRSKAQRGRAYGTDHPIQPLGPASHRLLTLAHSDVAAIQANLAGRPQPDLITAQLVLVNVRLAQRAESLRDWMSLEIDGSRMMVDVPALDVTLRTSGSPI